MSSVYRSEHGRNSLRFSLRGESADQEFQACEEIQDYYHRHHLSSESHYLDEMEGISVYTIALTADTFFHRNIMKENNMPYFPVAVYNTNVWNI